VPYCVQGCQQFSGIGFSKLTILLASEIRASKGNCVILEGVSGGPDNAKIGICEMLAGCGLASDKTSDANCETFGKVILDNPCYTNRSSIKGRSSPSNITVRVCIKYF